MLTHERINNDQEINRPTSEIDKGVQLSAQAVDTLNGIFNKGRNHSVTSNKENFREFVVGNPDNQEPSLNSVLSEIIVSADTTEVPLPHGGSIKVNNSREGICIARTKAKELSPWSMGNGKSYVHIPHQIYGSFNAINGKTYHLGGIFGGFEPTNMQGYLDHALSETRELVAALQVQQLNREPFDKALFYVNQQLRKLAGEPEMNTGFDQIESSGSISTLYDGAGYFIGAECLDWLTQPKPNTTTKPDSGLLISYAPNKHLRLSYQRESDYSGRYIIDQGTFEQYPIDANSDETESFVVLRPWLNFGRDHEQFSYVLTQGDAAGRGQLITTIDNPQRVAEFKIELGQALHIIADALAPLDA